MLRAFGRTTNFYPSENCSDFYKNPHLIIGNLTHWLLLFISKFYSTLCYIWLCMYFYMFVYKCSVATVNCEAWTTKLHSLWSIELSFSYIYLFSCNRHSFHWYAECLMWTTYFDLLSYLFSFIYINSDVRTNYPLILTNVREQWNSKRNFHFNAFLRVH